MRFTLTFVSLMNNTFRQKYTHNQLNFITYFYFSGFEL